MVKPGDPILKYLTANWFNRIDALERKLGVSAQGAGQSSNLYITIVNHEAVAKDKWEPIALGTPKFDYPTEPIQTYENIVFNTKALSDTEPHNWAVLQEPLPGKIGATARALLSGITWVNVEAEPTDDYLKIDTGDILASSASGRGYIHYTSNYSISVDTYYRSLVQLSNPSSNDSHYLFTITIPISDGWGVVTIRNMADDTEVESTAILKDPLQHFSGLGVGYRGICIKQEGHYYAITPFVIDVRYVIHDALQQTKDGVNYTDIEVPEDCMSA